MAEQIDSDTLRRWLDERRPMTVLDVRPEQERAQWAIPGSVHLDAYDALRSGNAGPLATFRPAAGDMIVTVCAAGRISQTAADILSARGFDARSLAGGMKSWSLAWNTAEVDLPGMPARVLQVRRTGKGCLSYIVGTGDEALVIDPSLPPQVYLDVTGRHGWRIRHVLETHIHADHLSRARTLAHQTGASVLLPNQPRARFPFVPVHDGDRIVTGPVSLIAHHTPGHTDEGTSYLLENAAIFTGDTLFTQGVGRPDLHANPDEARRRARTLFESLRHLSALGAGVLVLPAHTSDPVAFDGKPVTATIGEVLTWLRGWLSSESGFVERILTRLPDTPPNFARIVELNEAGELPEGDPTELEAGGNMCAIA